MASDNVESLDDGKHYHVKSLSELLGEEVLGILATGFCHMTGRPLGIVEMQRGDFDENTPLNRRFHYIMSKGSIDETENTLLKFCDYCREIRMCENTRQQCEDKECEIVARFQESKRQARPYWHICQFGLVDFAFPITVNNRVLGVFLSATIG